MMKLHLQHILTYHTVKMANATADFLYVHVWVCVTLCAHISMYVGIY
jgi:hypothetical protein